ncbi:MAG: phosphoribosyl-AMP cyclohydrolase [Aureliella sp.]
MKPKFDVDGLSPAIAQDARSGKVLMMAWMNEEAWLETLQSGRAVYFSRSRNKLWRKGEESGHVQQVIDARLDCDEDTILLRVEQTGAACHEGYETCFFRKVLSTGDVEICEQRLKTPDEIYTSRTTENN